MSDPNLKAMTQAELLKYLDEDFMPRLLPKLANINNLETENARLKAEVERLTALVESNLNSSKLAIGKADAVLHERDSLKAEVERLRQAGDEVVSRIQVFTEDLWCSIHRWNAAKEGKPSV